MKNLYFSNSKSILKGFVLSLVLFLGLASQIAYAQCTHQIQLTVGGWLERSRAAKSSVNSATTATSDLQLNAERPAEKAEFEAKINTLLTLVRAALVVESNKTRFRDNLEQSIRIVKICSVVISY